MHVSIAHPLGEMQTGCSWTDTLGYPWWMCSEEPSREGRIQASLAAELGVVRPYILDAKPFLAREAVSDVFVCPGPGGFI